MQSINPIYFILFLSHLSLVLVHIIKRNSHRHRQPASYSVDMNEIWHRTPPLKTKTSNAEDDDDDDDDESDIVRKQENK